MESKMKFKIHTIESDLSFARRKMNENRVSINNTQKIIDKLDNWLKDNPNDKTAYNKSIKMKARIITLQNYYAFYTRTVHYIRESTKDIKDQINNY